MNKAFALALFMLLACTAGLHAHSTWVQVGGEYNLEAPGSEPIFLTWGHHLPVNDPIDGKLIESVTHMSPAGQTTPLDTRDGLSFHPNYVHFADEGAHKVMATVKPGYYTMYINRADGKLHHHLGPQTDVLDDAQRVVLSLRYFQWAKCIVNVGRNARGSSDPVGRGLEIVPETEISSLKPGSALPFRVLMDGKPVSAPLTMDVSYLGYSTGPDDFYISKRQLEESAGQFDIARAGIWYVRVGFKRAAPAEEAQRYSHLHYTATLTFEVSPDSTRDNAGRKHNAH